MSSDTIMTDTATVNSGEEELMNNEFIFSEGERLSVKKATNSSEANSEENELAETRVYPNPARDQIRIEIPNRYIRKEIYLTITDLSGKIVKRQKIKNMPQGPYSIRIGNYDPGYYQIIISSGDYLDKQLVYIAR